MTTELNNLVDNYTAWLRQKITLRAIDEWFEITTPFLDRHNDYLQIYAKKASGGYELTDDAYVIRDLRSSGCDIDSEKRSHLLQEVLNGFNVQREGDALVTLASPDNFSIRKHNLIQAMLAVDDLFYLAQPYVTSLFFQDVAKWLDLHDIRYTPNVKFTGKSGYDYKFDFVIPKSRQHSERIISTINHPDKNAALKLFTAWLDTKEARPNDSEAYAFINDLKPPSSSVLQALKKYDIRPILWSQREGISLALKA